MSSFPVIDPAATGANIRRLRMARGLSVRDLQRYFGFEEPRAIYKWQKGDSLPSVDNLYALGRLFAVPLEEILVPAAYSIASEQQAAACCSPLFFGRCAGARRTSGRRTPDAPHQPRTVRVGSGSSGSRSVQKNHHFIGNSP